MKKLIVLLIAITCLICACGNGDELPPTSEMNTETNNNSSQGELSTESAEEQMQKLIDYNKAMDLLNSLTGELSVEQFEIMESAYSILEKLGDYKDVPEILAKFEKHSCKADENNVWVYDTQETLRIFISNGYSSYYSLYSYIYNDKEQIIRRNTKRIEPNANSREANYYNTYEYDSMGNITKDYYSGCDIWADSPSGSPSTYEYIYTYDELGNIINKTENRDGRIYKYGYTYDDKGYVIKETIEYDNGNTYDTFYIYDENGKMIEEQMESYSGIRITRYTYDEQGRVISEEHISDDPRYNSISTYSYKQYHLYNITIE